MTDCKAILHNFPRTVMILLASSAGFAIALAQTNASITAQTKPLQQTAPEPQPAPRIPAPVAVEHAVSSLGEIGNSLHLLVGRSMLINTTHRLRRIYVSNPDVLDSFTASPWQVVISARAAGACSVVLWDETGGSQAYLVAADVDVDGLRRELKNALPVESVHAEGIQDQIAMSGILSSQTAVDVAMKLAGLISKNVANALQVAPEHVKQVKLKVRMVEVDRTKLSQAGFNLFSTGTNTSNFTTGQFPSINSTSNSSSTGGSSSSSGSGTSSSVSSLLQLSDPLNLLFYNSNVGIGTTLKALQEKQVLQILAEPTITTISGEKASFLSGGEFPFPVVQGGTGGFSSVTVQFRPYGVKLDFTPVVTAEGVIRLKVAPEVSALDYSNEVTISGYTIPALATRRAETQVELKDGQSFAISGLLDHRTTDLLEKTPGISEVPILGNLFKSKNVNHSVVELMVIVTPMIVDPLAEPGTPEEPKLPIPILTPQVFDKTPGKAKIGTVSKGGNQP
jgi:pilus assembly protein CpaC